MSAQEFKVGQLISGTDYDQLPVGAKFRRGPQYSEYEVTETGFKLGMADTTLTAADYRSARRITYLPDATEPEPLKEGASGSLAGASEAFEQMANAMHDFAVGFEKAGTIFWREMQRVRDGGAS